jgi:hypothetical protein
MTSLRLWTQISDTKIKNFILYHRKEGKSMGLGSSAWGLVMELTTAYHKKLACYKVICRASDF